MANTRHVTSILRWIGVLPAAFGATLVAISKLRGTFGIEALRVQSQRGHPKILIGKRDEAVKVQRLIGVQMAPCCVYKFQHVRPRPTTGRGRALSEELIVAVKQDRGTCTMRAAALRHGIAVSKVWALWHES